MKYKACLLKLKSEQSVAIMLFSSETRILREQVGDARYIMGFEAMTVGTTPIT